MKQELLTIHTSRTIMTNELIKIMDFPEENISYSQIMDKNVFNKKTESSLKKTVQYLKQLYSFDENDKRFLSFQDYWNKIEQEEKPLLALLYAVNKDYLIKESVEFINSVKYNEKANIEGFEANIQRNHPTRFAPKTLRSVAQNVASSWKQAGYLIGKIKNIRNKRTPSYISVAYAFLMAYLDGARGEYLFEHPSVQTLDASKDEILNLLKEASNRDFLDYNKAGASLIISFDRYLKEL